MEITNEQEFQSWNAMTKKTGASFWMPLMP